MRFKIFIHYMVLVIIGVSITGFFSSQLAQKYYTAEVEGKLRSMALLIQANIAGEHANGRAVNYDALAKYYSSVLKAASETNQTESPKAVRITFIDKNGKVLGESEREIEGMENHLDREEVREALRGKLGHSIRFSATRHENCLYIAAPVDSTEVVVRTSVALVQLKSINKAIWFYSITGIIFGLILTALLAFRFSSSLINPIKELIDKSRYIAMGDYSQHVNISKMPKNELMLLATSFNEMALKLEKTMSEMIDKSIKVEGIIDSMPSGIIAVDNSYKIIHLNSIAAETFGISNTEEVIGTKIIEVVRNNQINKQLQDSIEKNISLVNEIILSLPQDKVLRIYTNPLKPKNSESLNSGGLLFIQDVTNIRKLEQIRTEFVSNVTHELKTPLTSIRGFIETLRSGAIDDREVAERFLEIIDIEAERLYVLINDILQLSEIESKQKDTNISTYSLKPIIEEIFSILQGTADKKGIKLSCNIDESLKIIANKNRVKQMVINLVDNAIKYNVDNGRVDVLAYKAEGKIVISVKDTGIGIPAVHLPRIFERFYRVDKGRSRNMGGTGLGLSIVKHIVNLYNGDVKVNSEPGIGTEFIISLPQ
ncbi:MAG: cell wall metabolism sensor histidine kinase WalK [Clostridia bacterium]|nr:cell wall metabolism sensor histidine kinase WalK [Clostridia bacterium]